MADKYEKYWQDPAAHTEAKLVIYRDYLGLWFGKLGQTMPRIVYIDGFAGRGTYDTGDVGSPLVALDVAANHIGNLANCDIRMFFIEQSAQNAAELEGRVEARKADGKVPKNITVEVVNGSFGEQMHGLVTGLETKGAQMAPSFVMIDPFGWTDFGMDLIHRLSALSPRSEVFVTFMERFISRAVPQDNEALTAELDRLFGGRESWIGVRDQPDAASRTQVLQVDAVAERALRGDRRGAVAVPHDDVEVEEGAAPAAGSGQHDSGGRCAVEFSERGSLQAHVNEGGGPRGRDLAVTPITQ